jgi:hypothetical protein
MSSHIFISHASKDDGFVKELRLDLEAGLNRLGGFPQSARR